METARASTLSITASSSSSNQETASVLRDTSQPTCQSEGWVQPAEIADRSPRSASGLLIPARSYLPLFLELLNSLWDQGI